MSEFFLELFSEEIPSNLQQNLREDLLKSFNEVDDEDINRGTIIVDAGNRDMTKQHEEIMKNFRPKVIETRKLGLRKEEVELGERYDLYHKDFSSAMQHAYAFAKKKGYVVDTDDIDSKVASGPKKPSSGKTNKYILGTNKKQNVLGVSVLTSLDN